MSRDIAYPNGVIDNDYEVMGESFFNLSPGYLGPDKGTNKVVLLCHVVLVVFVCLSVILMYNQQKRTDKKIDAGTTQPNDFAIMISGLPITATDEVQILEFFKENAIVGKTDPEIAKVVIGYDSVQYREKINRIKKLTKEMKNLDPTDPHVQDIQNEIKDIKRELASCASDIQTRLTSSGVAIVVFRFQSDLRDCLEKWTGFWPRWFYREPGAWGGLQPGKELQLFPFGCPPKPVYKIKVERAPNPGDVNWEDLGVHFSDRLTRFALTNGVMFLIICASFAVCYGMTKLEGAGESSIFLSILPHLGVALANMAVNMAAKQFGAREYHNTKTAQTSSQALKMSVGMIVNTAGVIFFVNAQPKEWYQVGGLISDVTILLGLTAVLQPLLQVVDFKYLINGCLKRRKLTDEKLKAFDEVMHRGPPKSKEEAQEQALVKAQIAYFKKAYEPSELDMIRRYAMAVRTFICALYYTPLMPIIALQGVVGIAVQYCVDKYLLVRWVKRPSIPMARTQAMQSLQFIRLAVSVLPFAVWIFLHPSWDNKGTVVYWMLVSFIPSVGLCIIPLGLAHRILFFPCDLLRGTQVAAEDSRGDYYTAQHMWSKDMKYHKSHFLYAGLPESKNPEMLKPGNGATLKADEVKGSYGAAAAAAADAAASGSDGATIALMGTKAPGVVVTGSSTIDVPSYGVGIAAPGEPLADSGAPASYGVGVTVPAAASSVTPAYGVAATTALPCTSYGVIGGADAEDDAAMEAEPISPETSGAVWEYETKKGYARFADDCHNYIEQKYIDFKSGGQARVRVKTGDIQLSIDFRKMSQMVEGKGYNPVRPIRRREGS